MQRSAQEDEQLVPVYQPDRAFRLQYRERSPAGIAAKQIHHFGDLHEGRNARNRPHEMLGAIGRGSRLDRLQRGQRGRVQPRHSLRPAEQIALQKIHTEVEDESALLRVLNALGNDVAPRDATHIDDGAQDFTAHGILLDAGDEVTVDLHVIGPNRRPGL